MPSWGFITVFLGCFVGLELKRGNRFLKPISPIFFRIQPLPPVDTRTGKRARVIFILGERERVEVIIRVHLTDSVKVETLSSSGAIPDIPSRSHKDGGKALLKRSSPNVPVEVHAKDQGFVVNQRVRSR